MATYKEIAAEIMRISSAKSVQSCWIADVMSHHGLTKKQAPNRKDPEKRVKPCPKKVWPMVEQALRNLGDLPASVTQV